MVDLLFPNLVEFKPVKQEVSRSVIFPLFLISTLSRSSPCMLRNRLIPNLIETVKRQFDYSDVFEITFLNVGQTQPLLFIFILFSLQ